MWDGYLIIVALIAAAARLTKSAAPARALDQGAAKFRWRVAARGRSVETRPKSA
jgi:hypothetical protein